MTPRRLAVALALATLFQWAIVERPALADHDHDRWGHHYYHDRGHSRHHYRAYYDGGTRLYYYAPQPEVYYAPPPVYAPPTPPSVGFNLIFPFRIR